MTAHPLLNRIRSDHQLEAILAWPFDFDVAADLDASWFRMRDGVNHVVVAKHGTGGVYALCGAGPPEQQPVLYVSPEGQAGIIGSNLQEFLGILLSTPYWWDLLKFSDGGRLQEMRSAVPYLERELSEDEPQIRGKAQYALERLAIDSPNDPVSLLHANVLGLSGQFTIISAEDEQFAPLFNTFVVADNPRWSRR